MIWLPRSVPHPQGVNSIAVVREGSSGTQKLLQVFQVGRVQLQGTCMVAGKARGAEGKPAATRRRVIDRSSLGCGKGPKTSAVAAMTTPAARGTPACNAQL